MKLSSLYKIFQDKWEKYQSCWIISDTHFKDEELRAGVRDRLTDDELIKKINSKVGNRDILIHLGDVGDIECVRRLKGYKVLVMGNHDQGRTNYERKIIYEQYDIDKYSKDEVYKIVKEKYPGYRIEVIKSYDFHAPFISWRVAIDNCLFDEVYEGPVMIGEKILLSHEPIQNINWVFNLHGHNHDKSVKNDKYHYNFCADVINYEPINFNTILKSGSMAKISSIHRITIDKATERKNKKEY